MTRYVLFRFIAFFITLLAIMMVMYFALRYAIDAFWVGSPFGDYLRMSWAGFKAYLDGVMHGNWGTYDGEPVWDVLHDRIILTLKYNLISFAIYLPVGIGIGIIAGLYPRSIFDKLVTVYNAVMGSIPLYIIMFLLVIYLGVFWRIWFFKYVGHYGIRNYPIPLIALTLYPIAQLNRVIRSELIESDTEQYLELALIKGMTRRRAKLRHSLRNSMTSVVPMIPEVFLYTLTGSFMVELIYRIPGVAQMFFDSMFALGPFDVWYPSIQIAMVMAIVVFYSVLSLGMNMITDVLIMVIDPRIRLQE